MKKILIVDDEQDIRELYEHYLLKIMGEENITVAMDGVDALMKCSIEKFDFILLDHRMPKLNGADLLVAIRTTHGPNRMTPIIVISGYIPEIEHAPHELAKTYFLNKPVDFKKLQLILHG